MNAQLMTRRRAPALRRAIALALMSACLVWAAPSATEAQIKFGTFEFAPAQPTPEPTIAGCPLDPPSAALDEMLRSPKALRSVEPKLRGSDWLGGAGVNVYYHPKGCADVSCSMLLSETFNTYSYQCVDLVVRLYGRLGILNNWYLQNAYEFRDVPKRKRPEFSHLSFYPNGESTRAPAPGDILVFGATSDNPAGHVAVVSRVLGDYLYFVQQNMYNACREAQPSGEAFIGQDDQSRFMVEPRDLSDLAYPPLLGWLSTPCMKRLVDSWPANKQHSLNGLSWNRDQSGVYVYLSPERTRQLSRNPSSAVDIAKELQRGGALSFTDDVYAECVIRKAASWLKEDARFSPSRGVRSVDFTLKYTGRTIWVRPWGGSQSGKWIPKQMPYLCSGVRFTGVYEPPCWEEKTSSAPAATSPRQPSPTPLPTIGCTRGRVEITSPGWDSVLSGVVPIMGTVTCEDHFRYYKFEIEDPRCEKGVCFVAGPPQQCNNTQIVCPAEFGFTRPVVNGTLMQWDTRTLPNGTYLLRLVAIGLGGNVLPEIARVRVTIQN